MAPNDGVSEGAPIVAQSDVVKKGPNMIVPGPDDASLEEQQIVVAKIQKRNEMLEKDGNCLKSIVKADNKVEVAKALSKADEFIKEKLAVKIVTALGLDEKFAEEILKDPKFQEIVQKLLSSNEDRFKNKPTNEFRENRKALNEYVKDFASNHNVEFDQKAFNKAFFLSMGKQREFMIDAKFASSPKFAEKKEEYLEKKEDIRIRFAKGELTEEQAQEEMDKLATEYIEKYGDKEDKELQNMMKQKKEMDTQDARDEYPVTDEQSRDEAIKEGQQEMSGTGFNITAESGSDELLIRCPGDSSFYTYVTVFQKSDDKYVYYLEDKFSNIGKSGPYDSNQLAEATDKRHIDSFLTQRLMSDPDAAKVSEIEDKNIVAIGEALIKHGMNRGYKVEGMDYKVLENLAKVLLISDPKYPSFGKKIDKLIGYETGYLLKETNAKDLKNKLLKGEIGPLSSMVG